jgi:CheY-like chemotaxis protein
MRYVYVGIHVCACMCVRVCVCERERVCVCVCLHDSTHSHTQMQLYILNMKYNVDVMATIVDDILDLNVLRMGQLALRSRPFMACAAAATVDGVLGSLLEGSGKADVIEHSCECSDELLKLTPHGLDGDGARVLQILFNLTSNAARMTTAGSIAVLLDVAQSVETAQERAPAPAADPEAGAHTNGSLRSPVTATPLVGVSNTEDEVKVLHLRITVRDTGPGLDPAHIPVLLEQFSSAKSKIIQKSGGTGLGLPLIKSVVDAMGGSMQIDCAAGRPGVTVVVVLPLAVMSKAAEVLPHTPSTVTPNINTTALRNSELSKWVRPKSSSSSSSSRTLSLLDSNNSTPMHEYKDGQLYSSNSSINGSSHDSPRDQLRSVPARHHMKTTLRQLVLIKAAASEIDTKGAPRTAQVPFVPRAQSVSSDNEHAGSTSGSPLSRSKVTRRRSVHAMPRSNSISTNQQTAGARGSVRGLELFMEEWKENNRVLVVDDVKLNCLLLRKYTEQGGYKGTVVAVDGLKALQVMEKDWREHEEGSKEPRVSIVLMDCNMPVMDGYVATKKIRKFNSSVAIFAVTGNAMVDQKQKCFDCGMDDLVLKPFDKATIVSVLDGYVRSLYLAPSLNSLAV